MPRPQTQCEALSVGQLAKRWGVSTDRIWQLIRAGHLPEAFTIPSAGRYGETTKIPLRAVVGAEEAWLVADDPRHQERPQRRSRAASGAPLKHFPELSPTPVHDAESHASDPRSDVRSDAAYG